MCKSYALAGLVLDAGAAEQVEDALMVLAVDAAAVVDDVEDRKAELSAAADLNIAGLARLQIFHGVVDQVGEDLLQRKAIADDVRQRPDADLCVRLDDLMGDGVPDAIDQ